MDEEQVLRIPAELERMDEVDYEYRDGCNRLTIRKRMSGVG